MVFSVTACGEKKTEVKDGSQVSDVVISETAKDNPFQMTADELFLKIDSMVSTATDNRIESDAYLEEPGVVNAETIVRGYEIGDGFALYISFDKNTNLVNALTISGDFINASTNIDAAKKAMRYIVATVYSMEPDTQSADKLLGELNLEENLLMANDPVSTSGKYAKYNVLNKDGVSWFSANSKSA